MAKHTFTTVAIASLLALGARVSPAQIHQQESLTCQEYGFQPGTAEMAHCVMTVDQGRANRKAVTGAIWDLYDLGVGQP